MKTLNNTLLSQARSCLSKLIDSSFLDEKDMINDCLEVFDTIEWMQRSDLSEDERIRWSKLLKAGNDGDLDAKGLLAFFELTSSEGNTHAYYGRVHAQKLIAEIQMNATCTTHEHRDQKVWRSTYGNPIQLGLMVKTSDKCESPDFAGGKFMITGLSFDELGLNICINDDGVPNDFSAGYDGFRIDDLQPV